MGMWYRNSGGYISSRSTGDEPQDHEMSQMPESAAMYSVDDADMRGVSTDPDPDLGDKSHENGDDPGDEATDKDDHHVSDIQPVEFPYDMQDMVPEEQVTSLFFDPTLNIPDPSLDFEWLFDNISTDFNSVTNGGLPVVVSPQSSISATGISPPSFPIQSPYIGSPASSHSSTSSPWITVRGNLLTALNILTPEILMSSFFYPSNLCHFYDLYFQNYHPHFPILHKPTMDPLNAPPLLIAAIVTLGSTLSSNVEHFQISTNIHDSLRYIIFNVRLALS